MSEWAFKEKGAKSFYKLLDTWTVYNKGICDGFDWMLPRLADAKLARLLLAEPRTEKLSDRATIELVMEQLAAAQAMQALLQRQSVAV